MSSTERKITNHAISGLVLNGIDVVNNIQVNKPDRKCCLQPIFYG